jgi:hypothetical protein
MSNYVQSTNFATKDALTSGDPLKIVKGTEINTEYVNIAVAIATKADIASPTFTGSPVLPTGTTGVTQSAGNNSTALSTTAYTDAAIAAVKLALFPVGAIYTATVSTNPASLIGFGTWTAFGAGRVLIGNGGGFSAGATGGSADAVLVSHTHTISSAGSHQHYILSNTATNNPSQYTPNVDSTVQLAAQGANGFEAYVLNSQTAAADGGLSSSAGSHSHTIDSNGVSATNANLQPYIVVYMWQRTG